jgi:hypothetical protein
MILVYTHKTTPRLVYILKMVFTQFLETEVKVTNQVEEFIAFEGVKISYTKNPLGSELFFSSHDLLFEKGIHDYTINIRSNNGQKVFFEQS